MTQVSLSAITMPTTPGVSTAEEFIAYAARVSNPGNQQNSETAPKLLKYLIKNKHWSPFEMVHMTLEINTTRDIAHQIVRHRSFAFQEFSQRYADVSCMGFTTCEARLQDTKNRQNSVETDDRELEALWLEKQQEVIRLCKEVYTWALTNGIAKELARKPLPEGLTNSRLYMSGSLRSWIHYVEARCYIGTQKEHRVIAEQVLEILKKEFPSLAEYLSDKS